MSGERATAVPTPPARPFHVKRTARRLHSVLTSAFLAPLRLYARWVSPAFPRRCRYEPTCSAYAEQAIRELGILRGTIVAAWRLLRCNPLSHGGVDDVSDRRLFRGPAARASRTGAAGAAAAEPDEGRA